MSRRILSILALLLTAGSASATSVHISPGNNAIQTAVSAAAASGDTIYLRDGTYTEYTVVTDASYGVIFDSGFTGDLFTNLVIRSANPGGATIDMTGPTAAFWYGGDASGVVLYDLIWTGTVTGATCLNNTNNNYKKWVIDTITLGITKPMMVLGTGASNQSVIGPQLTIRNITTNSSFTGQYLVQLRSKNASNEDLLIENINMLTHGSGLVDGVWLADIRDARLRNIKVATPSNHGITVTTFSPTCYSRDIYISDVFVDTPGQVGIHIGRTDSLKVTTRIKVHDVEVVNSAAYGLEFENGVTDSEYIGFRVTNAYQYGIALAEDTERCTISGGVVDGLTGVGVNASGIISSVGHYHRITNNVITNVPNGIQLQYQGGFTIPIERNLIRENVFYDCDYIYRVSHTSMPSGALAHMIGPNTVYTPNVAYATSGDSTRTQAQFETQYKWSIDNSDVIINAATPNWHAYSEQQAANILAGNRTAPYTAWSKQVALNRLVGNTSGTANKYSAQSSYNLLIGP